jgi:superfamily II DNA or RNA helicase
MFSAMVQSALNKGKNVLIVTDRVELLTQTDGALTRFDISPEYIRQGQKKLKPSSCYIAMIESLNRRMQKHDYLKMMQSVDLVIIDEAHKGSFDKLFAYIPQSATIIGATATPHREGNQKELKEFYTKIVDPVTIRELIDEGYLAAPTTYSVPVDLSGVRTYNGDYDAAQLGQAYSKQKVFRGVIQNYQLYCQGKKALAFAPSIASSKELCQELDAAGLPARHLDSNMKPDERQEVLAWFKDSANGILCNCGILTTGFDDPNVEVVILYRATKSLPLYLQMCGRGSRVTPTKKAFTILDFGNNRQQHNAWEVDRVWKLEKKQKKSKGIAPVKNCRKCGYMMHTSMTECPACGYVAPVRVGIMGEEVILEISGKYTPSDYRKIAKESTLEEVAALIKLKKIKLHWVLHSIIKDKQTAKRLLNLCGYRMGYFFFLQELKNDQGQPLFSCLQNSDFNPSALPITGTTTQQSAGYSSP